MELDYTQGIRKLRALLPPDNPALAAKFSLLEARLVENLDEKKYGPDPTNQAQRVRLIAEFDKFISEDLHLSVHFIDLCRSEKKEVLAEPVNTPAPLVPRPFTQWQEGEVLSIQGQDYRVVSAVQGQWLAEGGAFSQQAPGRHVQSGQRVWLKQCQLGQTGDAASKWKRDLEKEGRLLLQLQRESQRDFPRPLGSESSAQSATLVYEMLPGRSLALAFDALPKPLDSQATRRLLAGRHTLIKMLHALHTMHYSHRSLTPEALLLQPASNRIILADLGLAACSVRLGEGPPFYQSPEQLKGLPVPDRATDIYQLGALFYDLLTGRHITDTSVSQESGLSPELEALLRKAAAPLPRNRWPNVYEFSNALSRLGY